MKILYAPGYGAGWVTWNSALPRHLQRLMLTWPPLIEAVESDTDRQPACDLLEAEIHKHLPDEYVCFLGLPDLRVRDVYEDFILNEYDGYESISEVDSDPSIFYFHEFTTDA